MTNVHLHVTRAWRAWCVDGSGYMHVPIFIYQYECGRRDPRGRSRLTYCAGAGPAPPVTYDARCVCSPRGHSRRQPVQRLRFTVKIGDLGES